MKTKLTVITALTLISSALLTAPANAADTGMQEMDSSEMAMHPTSQPVNAEIHNQFVKLDKNKDGYIEKNEARSMAALNKEFSKISKDGRLYEKEYAAWQMSKKTADTKHKVN